MTMKHDELQNTLVTYLRHDRTVPVPRPTPQPPVHVGVHRVVQTWTNQRSVSSINQSHLTWLQYSYSGPIRGEYCVQLTNHSSLSYNTHPLDQSEETIVTS